MTDTATRNELLADKTVTDLLVTTEAVIRDLDRWEYVYSRPNGACLYRDERGAPDCLIGHVLYRWGVLDEEEGNPTARALLSDLGASELVAVVANSMQIAQDRGDAWGEALEAGHALARALGERGVIVR